LNKISKRSDKMIVSDEESRYMEKEGIRALCYEDAEYPPLLKQIYDPPQRVFYKGKIKEIDINAVAIVGARRCSLYGYRTAEKIAYELALRGITVISGMARGIDSAAHIGALKAKGRTIAVMGSGFRHIYPPESEGLSRQICEQGAVITEFLSGIVPSKWTFPKRNRIVSGLAKAVVVVEAASKSGALITVDFALQQGKDVFAVPGQIDMVTSSGTNSLIKDGAKMVTSVDDILEELNIEDSVSIKTEPLGEKNSKEPVSDKETEILNVIRKKSDVRIDNLPDLTGMNMKTLSELLLRLEIKGKIKALPGKIYKIC